jgi:hypothetical protein
VEVTMQPPPTALVTQVQMDDTKLRMMANRQWMWWMSSLMCFLRICQVCRLTEILNFLLI